MTTTALQRIKYYLTARAVVPKKFWLNPKTYQMVECKDHCYAVIDNDLNLPVVEIAEWRERLAQILGHAVGQGCSSPELDEELDQNNDAILATAMKHGWVRGGSEGIPFLQADKMTVLRAAVKYLKDMYDITRVTVECGTMSDRLEGYEIDKFLESKRANP